MHFINNIIIRQSVKLKAQTLLNVAYYAVKFMHCIDISLQKYFLLLNNETQAAILHLEKFP